MGLTKVQFLVLDMLAEDSMSMNVCSLKERLNLSLKTIESTVLELEMSSLINDKGITANGITALEPYRVDRAIFMAAGFGSRLSPITINTPKPLVRVNGVRIIDTLIDACLAAKIRDIYVVRGYLGESFDQLLSKYPNIHFIENHAYGEANNISSVMAARHLLPNAYVFEADLLLSNPGIIRRYQYSSNFLGIKKSSTEDWCFRVKDGVIKEELTSGFGDDIWQMVGISYWNRSDGAKLIEDLPEIYSTPSGKACYWEQVPLVHKKVHYRVEIRDCHEEDVVEIDTFEELKAIDSSYAL